MMRGRGKIPRALAMAAAAGAIVSIIGVAASGLGARAGFWHFSVGFTILRWTAFLGFACALAGLFIGAAALAGGAYRALGWALLSVVIGGVAAGVPFRWQQAAQSLPPIHDVTTDTQDPPRFIKAVGLRKDAGNPVAYGGELVALIQQRSYPEIRPLRLGLAPGEAFALALDTAGKLGWDVTASVPEKGRIEAVDATFWFGFKDDVVVRVTAAGEGSRVDVRSLSRVGTGDVGTNARRVKKFLGLMERAAGKRPAAPTSPP